MNDSFELEGLEIRIQQKVLAEFVEQSTGVDVDYTVNPKIYFGDDGRIYFFDETVEEPIPLEKVENFYERIRIEDGELRFYDKDISFYVNLSFFVDSDKRFVDKPNTLIENVVKREDRDPTYDSREEYINVLKRETASEVISSGYPLEQIIDDFEEYLFEGVLLHSGMNLYDFFSKHFTYGVSNFDGGFSNNSATFNLDTGHFINRKTIINDTFMTILDDVDSPPTATELYDKLFAKLVNEASQITQSYDGIGRLLHKFLGEKKGDDIGKGFDVALIANNENKTFTISGGSHYACSEDDLSNALFVEDLPSGYVAFKPFYGEITADVNDGTFNRAIASSSCDGDPSISIIESTQGEIPYESSTYYKIDTTKPLTVWLKDNDPLDNSGAITYEYVTTPRTNSQLGTFLLDPSKHAAWTTEESEGLQTFVDDEPTSPRKKLLGVFDAGEIKLSVGNGYVRPDLEPGTRFNVPQSYIVGVSGSDGIEFGYVNTTLGRVGFNEEAVFENPETQLIEVWYEDFDESDNDGLLQIFYEYTGNGEITEAEQEAVLFPGFIKNDSMRHLQPYAIDHLARLLSFGMHALWWDALYKEFKARGLIEVNRFLGENDDANPTPFDEYLEGADRRFAGPGYDAFPDKSTFDPNISDILRRNFYQEKVFYENQEFIENFDLGGDEENGQSLGVMDFRNYFLYKGGSGLVEDDILKYSLEKANDVWMEFPNGSFVVPKVKNDYAMSIFANFTADYMYGVPCKLEFRLFDSTSQTTLDNIVYEFSRTPHTEDIGDALFENKETLQVQLAYFGPVSKLKCREKDLKCSTNDVNSHFPLETSSVVIEDAVDQEAFQVITERLLSHLEENESIDLGDNLVDVEAPRVLRVQWRYIFDEEETGGNWYVRHDIPQFKFDSFAPQNENLFTVNTFSFAKNVQPGFTVAGSSTFRKNIKRVTVRDERLSTTFDDKYSISLAPSKNVNVWVEDKTIAGFVIVSEKEFEGAVDWVATRSQVTNENNRSEERKLIPPCVIDRSYPHHSQTDFEILSAEGFYTDKEEEIPYTPPQNVTSASDIKTFVDPNGVACSQNCTDDCPPDYICSPDCYTASLTESGCGCCECINDNDCPPGFMCNELNECIEI